MPAGDVNISKLKIGDIDLTQYKEASYVGLNIYEDILNAYGPVCEIRVLDHSDALGKKNVNGAFDKDIEIAISNSDFGGEAKNYKLKFYQNKNLNDQSVNGGGSGHHKQYDIRGVSPEMLKAQGNYIQKSYKDQTHNIVKDVVKTVSDKQLDIKSKSDVKRRVILNNKHFLDSVRHLNDIHSSNEEKSSCFVLYQETGQQSKYVFATFEKLFQEKPTVTLSQSVGLDGKSSFQEKQNSIIWFRPSNNFFTPSRPLAKSKQKTFNMTTHASYAPKDEEIQFKLPDQPVYKGKPSNTKEVPIYHTYDKANDKEKHTTADAKTNRAAFLSHLMQNSAELETYYNPKIKLGCMIELKIPNKSNEGGSGGEKQFNGKCLVVAIRTKIKPLGQTPRATMVLRVIKASYKEGGNGEA